MLNRTINTLTFIFLSLVSLGQKQEEYKIHLHSINTTYHPGHIIDRSDTVFNANQAFIDYTIKNFLKNPSDIKYISNRTILPKLKQTTCDSVQTKIIGTLSKGETVEILIQTGQFDSTKHTISRYKEKEYGDAIEKIDGQYPYGGEYGMPNNEVKIFSVTVNGKQLKIPKAAYQNLFEPNMCSDGYFDRKIEAYSSIDGQFIYVYIYGGNAASTYFAKLIFNKKKYLTKIVADYYSLSIHSSFRDSFIGY
jgi:hypothetical protein